MCLVFDERRWPHVNTWRAAKGDVKGLRPLDLSHLQRAARTSGNRAYLAQRHALTQLGHIRHSHFMLPA